MTQSDLTVFQNLLKQILNKEKEIGVVQPIPAEKLFKQLDLNLSAAPMEDESFYKVLEEIVLQTPLTASNKFFNQLFGGRKSKAVLGEMLAAVLNNSMYTYKVAGPMVGVEKSIIDSSCELINYGESADGTITSGGSMSNFMAMVMGRDYKLAQTPKEGVSSKMIIYTSANSHYSIEKNAALIGIGREQVHYINSDEKGIMNSDLLAQQISNDLENGMMPFMINATAGTTVMGSFDNIEELAELAEKFDLWLHVDGSYCGAVMFSSEFRHLINGVERANSFNYNAHKMLGVPLTCSVLLTKNRNSLLHSFSNDAEYLYQTDDDEYNLGKTSFQCGRRNDALKFWCLWKSIGTNGLGEMVEKQFALAEVARNYVKDHPDYTLYSYPDSISICFNYKDLPADQICTLLYEHAELMVGYGQFNGNEFIRMVTINNVLEEKDIIEFFETLEQFVENKSDQFKIYRTEVK